jgi:arylsulfatase B
MKRREFLENSAKGAAGLALSSSLISLISCSSDSVQNPNIIVIVSDDTGWNDVGYHNPLIKTPNIDRLANHGIELNSFYVSPVCSPTRAALLTGKHPSRYGILGPIVGGMKETLPKETITLAEFLRRNGYQTAITGKWHLGLKPEDGPKQFGFDYTYGYFHGQLDPRTHLYKWGDKTWHRNDQYLNEEGHATDLITNEAIKYISDIRSKEKPFFLYVPYSAPHFPVDEDQKWLDMYPEVENLERKKYCASMTHMDDGIGQIIKSLEKNKLLDNSLIIYMSDNGGCENFRSGPDYYGNKFPPAEMLGDNKPLRGWKGELYEGGIRVPALFYWKGKLNPGKVEEVIAVEDFYPTFAGLIKTKLPDNHDVEGTKVWSAIEGKDIPERILYWRTDKQYAIRKGEWKLIHNGANLNEGTDELYNMKLDPYEKENLFELNQNVTKILKDEMQKNAALDPL